MARFFFFLWTFFIGFFSFPVFFFNRKFDVKIWLLWANITNKILKLTINLNYEIKGIKNLNLNSNSNLKFEFHISKYRLSNSKSHFVFNFSLFFEISFFLHALWMRHSLSWTVHNLFCMHGRMPAYFWKGRRFQNTSNKHSGIHV